MRNWHFLIPVIAVAVWILSSLIRGGDERVRRPRPQADPDEPPNPDRSQRSANEIDRFLQEVQRRRQESGPRPEPAAKDIPQAILVEPILVAEAPRRGSARPKPAPSKRRNVEVAPAPTPEVPDAVVMAWQEPVRVAAAAPPPPAPRAPGVAAPQASAVTRQVLALLRSPQSLATAILLREILDRPLSTRPRRAGGGAA